MIQLGGAGEAELLMGDRYNVTHVSSEEGD